ncbi:RrF2 family transcriptional regulator [Micromonospora sp. NPDC049275]|uniref:RrF2 family transcriptional regulator n=1 Tax=Micromonospora sp. NPDC049275 TaxID=3364268 RepID=UPI0037247B1C
MRINRSSDIALRIVMLGASRGGRSTIDELAVALAVPRTHLAKVVQRLQHLGVLETTRGRGGGVRLISGTSTVTVGQLLRDLEGESEVVSCDEPACPLLAGCRLRAELRVAQEAFYASLDRVSIDDLIAAPTSVLLAAPSILASH